jgi:ribosomal protein L12E/L44/L45/RPP1/RPP2
MITTEQDALEAVRQDGMALEDVPEKLKTPEICAEAVCGSGWALAFVPEALKTPELCLAASRDARAEALVLMPARSACTAAALEAVWQDENHPLDAVRARLEAQGISEQDVEDAVAWARGTLKAPWTPGAGEEDWKQWDSTFTSSEATPGRPTTA